MAVRMGGAEVSCAEQVHTWMRELYGEQCAIQPDGITLKTPYGSTFVHTTVRPLGTDAVIKNTALVVAGARINFELAAYLLSLNSRMRFGAFGINQKDGSIVFSHALLGSSATKAALRVSWQAVAESSDTYDDHIIKTWGGKTAHDVEQGGK